MSTNEQTERDDDMPAIDGGPETPDDNDAGAPPDEPGHGPVRYRGVSERTRELFKTAASKLKEQLDAGDGDDYEPAIGVGDNAQGAPAKPAAAASAPQGLPPTVTPPPAPSLSPDAARADDRARITLEAREKSAADREAALNKREAALEALEKSRERYIESPADAIAELVKQWTGIDSDGDLRDEITDLITQLSMHKLELKVPDDIKNRVETRKATRSVKAWKADDARKRAAEAKRVEDERAAAAEKARHESGKSALSQFLPTMKNEKGDHLYPFLMAEENPHEIVWDVVLDQYEKAGKPEGWQPDLAAVAKMANEYFESQARRYFDKRRHLLTTTAAPAASAVASAPQGDHQSRRSSTLTNRTTAPVAPASSEVEATGDERRRRSLRKLREGNGASAT